VEYMMNALYRVERGVWQGGNGGISGIHKTLAESAGKYFDDIAIKHEEPDPVESARDYL